MEPVRLSAWPHYFQERVEPGYVEGSPERHVLTLRGKVNTQDRELFDIGVSRDVFGTLLRVSPVFPLPADKRGKGHSPEPESERSKWHEKNSADERKWRQAWAKIATRAGYRMPGIDPYAYDTLCALASTTQRLEFIFDTTELNSGTVHWLVRMFGERADLVRTVISDKEIHGYSDQWGSGDVNNMKTLLNRANFLGSSRLLERLPHPHPIWRSLDVDDEGALLWASGSEGDKKSPGADTLLLRAVRRSIQEQIPGLRRFFVTGDAKLARTAAHMLPAGSTIATWVTPLDGAGEVLAPLHWWPQGSEDSCGAGAMTQLAHFIREALCICAEIHICRDDRLTLVVREYRPGQNEYPSLWTEPLLWVEQLPSGSSVSRSPMREPLAAKHASSADKREQTGSSEKATSATQGGLISWPLRTIDTSSSRQPTAIRLPPGLIFAAITDVMYAAQDDPTLVENIVAIETDYNKKLCFRFLQKVGLIDKRRPTHLATSLPDIFRHDDIDALTNILARLEPLAEILDALHKKPGFVELTIHNPRQRLFSRYAALARSLGQAVAVDDRLWYGGGAPSQPDFENWLVPVIQEESAKDPLGEAPMRQIASRALQELHLSPARLQRALRVVLSGPLGKRIRGSEGGTIDRTFLAEEVVRLMPDGFEMMEMSGDGLCGLRSLSWRPA